MASRMVELSETIGRMQSIKELVQTLGLVSARLAALEGDARKAALTEAQLDTVLFELTNRGVWGPKNQQTMDSIILNGAARYEAFATLTDGNPVVREIVAAVLEGEPFTVTPDPRVAEKTEPDPVVEPEPEPTAEEAPPKRRGRPRRDS